MCISATILAAASLATAAAGTAMSIASANANAAAQQQQLKIQQEQMIDQLRMERLQAAEAEVARLSDFRRQRAANMVAMATSGLSENLSFLQGIQPAEERALKFDLRNIRLGLLGQENRIANDIRVNRLNSQMVAANRSNAVAGSLIGFAGSALQIGQFYDAYRTPSASSMPGTAKGPAPKSMGLDSLATGNKVNWGNVYGN